MEVTDYTADNVLKLFNELSKHFNNIEAIGTKKIKVCSDLYNAIVDHPLNTAAKHSTVNIDGNEVVKFKGFLVEEVPDELFQSTDCAYAYIQELVNSYRNQYSKNDQSEDFDGVALQGAGKAGEFILKDNKKAVVKVSAGE